MYDGSDTHLAAGLQIEGHAFLDTMLSDNGCAAMREYVELSFEDRRAWLEQRPAATHTGR